ncbi:MAG TPA: hypothetical protein VL335_01570 [Candidatus Paceibacterota bacterium]|nr:hypothetical protein [Candidatus Paceibacterota bacterium]
MILFSKVRPTYIFVSIAIIIIVCTYVWSISKAPSTFELYVFNTKGKPSIFIRTPEDERILINGGANGDVVRYLTKTIPFYSRRIDAVILTKDDGNHVTGLIDIINRYTVRSVIISTLPTTKLELASSTDQIYATFMDTAHALGIPVKEVSGGDELHFTGFTANMLFPTNPNQANHSTSSKDFTYSKTSPPELVLKISHGVTSFLLAGDSSTKIQKFLAQNRSINIQANVLVVPHSASASSLSLDFINAVRPEFIIYSQSSASSKSKKTDPLYMILDDRRFNVQQKNTVKVLSDGESVEII